MTHPKSLMVLTLVLLVLVPSRSQWASQVPQLISTGSLTSKTPVRDGLHPDLVAAGHLLHARGVNPSALTRKKFRGYFVHPLCFIDLVTYVDARLAT
jgi:hypothetical protein